MKALRRITFATTMLFAVLSLALSFASTAGAKEVVDYFGTPAGGTGTGGGEFKISGGVAVNNTGAGPASKGDIYVADPFQNRIERFGRDDHGTSDPADDSYFFISAWGADVDGVLAGGSDYEICTVAPQCKEGVASSGNGTTAGNGSLDMPDGLGIDQDTGNVYISDLENGRVSVYDGAGNFLRSFGFDVVSSGPGNTGTGFEVCVAAAGDVCKKGLSGSGVGQIGAPESGSSGIAVSQPDGNVSTGTVFVADRGNHRVDTFGLDGSSPSSFGSSKFSAFGFGYSHPSYLAVDSRGIVYASNVVAVGSGLILSTPIERYDFENANGNGVGFLAPITSLVNEGQKLVVTATGGEFKLTFAGETTASIPYNASAIVLLEALLALPSIDPGSIEVNGGPGNTSGSVPFDTYYIVFRGSLGSVDVSQITTSNGNVPLSGGSATVTTVLDGAPPGPLISTNAQGTRGLVVDPADDTLYVFRNGEGDLIQQFGPVNDPGLTAPPTAADAQHGTSSHLSGSSGLALDGETGNLYASAGQGGDQNAAGVYVLGPAGPPSTATLDSLSDITSTSVVAHATIDPNGPPQLSYWLEYSTDGVKWTATPATVLGTQTTPQSLTIPLAPPAGLSPNTDYQLRLVAKRLLSPALVSPALPFTTLGESSRVETVGAPIRSATTAELNARVNPRGAAATYHLEYGSAGPCDANPCASTPDRAAGSGDEIKLVSERVTGLQAGTTYHYRVVADNGEAGSPSFGSDRTVTTRVSDAPLSHGHFPGPPGSDRAYEQVSLSDSSGNPVSTTDEPYVSGDGESVIYLLRGGTDITESGQSIGNVVLSERPAGSHPQVGWQSRTFTPPRASLPSSPFWALSHTSDLSSILGVVDSDSTDPFSAWALSPDSPASPLFHATEDQKTIFLQGLSADGTRKLLALKGGVADPAYPGAGAVNNLYDINSGSTQLASVLPSGAPACIGTSETEGQEMPGPTAPWISPDGSRVYFTSTGDASNCTGPRAVFMRDLVADETTAVSGAPLSGATCDSYLLRTTATGVYFFTTSRLAAEDTAPGSCEAVNGNGDIYRYDLGDGSRTCLTCAVLGGTANILVQPMQARAADESIGIAADGSRIYFHSAAHLLPGSPPKGKLAIYRFDVTSDSLAFVAAVSDDVQLGRQTPERERYAVTPDGSVVTFFSSSITLDPLGGSTNAGTRQYYRYDDDDRSLVCLSCPTDDSAPVAVEPGNAPVSEDGDTVAFATPTALLGADQNTPKAGADARIGTDIYEWRDGRLLLVTDGLTSWPSKGLEFNAEAPRVPAISPSGRDIYFTAAGAYTADALDGYTRLYDARIGGGIEFPEPPRPCPLEVCQGTPQGAPEEPPPGTSEFRGPGNPVAKPVRCPRGKVRRKGRCVKKHHKRRQHKSSHRAQKRATAGANHDRRATR